MHTPEQKPEWEKEWKKADLKDTNYGCEGMCDGCCGDCAYDYLDEDKVKDFIRTTLHSELEKYTAFLLKNGYVDDDVWAEEPTTLERYELLGKSE